MRAAWPNLKTKTRHIIRVTKKALEYLESCQHPLAAQWRDKERRSDGALDIALTREELRELWFAMDTCIEVAGKSRPQVNSAIGMMRKIERVLPGAPW